MALRRRSKGRAKSAARHRPGQLCYVHYSGMLSDGTVFDSSRTAGRGPLQFNVGQGQVIPGWDLTVATMLKGEKCVVKIAPEYAYGDSGAGNVIPPNATLTFQMELIDFTDGMGMSNLTIFLLLALALPSSGIPIFWGSFMRIPNGRVIPHIGTLKPPLGVLRTEAKQ